MRSGDVGDLAAVEIGERAAEREDGAEGVALVHLRLKDPDAALSELGFDRLQQSRTDGGVCFQAFGQLAAAGGTGADWTSGVAGAGTGTWAASAALSASSLA